MINTNVCEMHVQIVRCYVKYLQIHNWCTCTLNYIQLFTYALKTYASNLVETALRFNLRVSYFQNFLEGHVPRPPRRLVLCTAECTSHTTVQLDLNLMLASIVLAFKIHCQTLEDIDCYIRDKFNVHECNGGSNILLNVFICCCTNQFALPSIWTLWWTQQLINWLISINDQYECMWNACANCKMLCKIFTNP